MVKLLLGLDAPPSPHDAADALAVAICHLHSSTGARRTPRCSRRSRASRRAAGATIDREAPPRARMIVIAHLRGTLLEKAPSRLIVDVGGVGYDVQVPLSTFYVVGDPGVTVVAADPHPRARGRHRALRVRHGAGARRVRAADRHQRHRAEAGAGRAVRHRAGGLDRGRSRAGRGPA